MVSEITKNNKIGNFNKTFTWFRENFVPVVQNAVQEFWNSEVECRLFCIFDNGVNLFKGEEFFVTKVFSQNEEYTNSNEFVLVKISQEICQSFLEATLGKNDFSGFKFEYLTELETKVLTEFNTLVGNEIFKLAEKNSEETDPDKYFSLLFYVKTANGISGKVILSLPFDIFTPKEIEINEFKFAISTFDKSMTEVSITVGNSKTYLSELQHLEKGDVVVLENSRLNKMTLHINGETTEIKVNPDPSLILNTSNEEEQTMGEKLSKDMWDAIQVEIGAEFEKIKISLGELRQISEGLVVDIGSVYKNKICLKVENRTIANGELVIVNDRYGIRIDEVFQQGKGDAVKEQIPVAASIKEEPESLSIEEEDANEEENEESFEEDFDENSEEENEDDEFSDFDVDEEDL